jgi:hypothetical protein
MAPTPTKEGPKEDYIAKMTLVSHLKKVHNTGGIDDVILIAITMELYFLQISATGQ